MIELGVNNLSKQFGETTIFEKITFELKTGERVGLIGANGTGKTTLMKIVMGEENLNKGDMFVRKGAKLGYLNQIPDYAEDMLVSQVIRQAFKEVEAIRLSMEKLEKEMSNDSDNIDGLVKKHGALSGDFERLGGYMMDTELSKITIGLSIDSNMLNQKFNSLSGGEQTRVVLARILLEKPDVLLLDEPSNHLDMDSIEWLEGYLDTYEGAILIISHDRYFLDKVVNRIIELTYDEAIVYHGNYTYYTVEKERRFLLAMKYYEQQAKKIKRVEEQIKRYRIWGEMRDSDKMYRRAKELEKRLEKMEKLKRPIYEKRKVVLNMNASERTGKKVFIVEDIYKDFEEKKVLQGIDFQLGYKEFMCILGGNGSGKTTLFRIMTGELKARSGSIQTGSKVKTAYLPQHIEFEDESMTVLEYFTSIHPIDNREARKQLAKALFVKDDVFKKVRVLSGGEKSRLKLNALMYGDVNVLLLDEPTNHLDIESREVLEENLLNYDGSLLFVSHDRYFVAKLAGKVGEINKGKMTIYKGDYHYYKEEKEKRKKLTDQNVLTAENKPEKTSESNKNKSNLVDVSKKVLWGNTDGDSNKSQVLENEVKALSKNAQKQLVIIEASIEKLEEEITSLESSLIDVGDSIERLEEAMDLIKSKQNELDELYEKWEQLTI